MPEAMAEALEVEATVVEALPNALYRLELREGDRRRITAHLSAGAGLLRLRPGESVVVALEPYDTTRGRITRRGNAPE